MEVGMYGGVGGAVSEDDGVGLGKQFAFTPTPPQGFPGS